MGAQMRACGLFTKATGSRQQQGSSRRSLAVVQQRVGGMQSCGGAPHAPMRVILLNDSTSQSRLRAKWGGRLLSARHLQRCSAACNPHPATDNDSDGASHVACIART